MSDDLLERLIRLEERQNTILADQEQIMQELKLLTSLNDKRKGAFWAFGIVGAVLASIGFTAVGKIFAFLGVSQ